MEKIVDKDWLENFKKKMAKIELENGEGWKGIK